MRVFLESLGVDLNLLRNGKLIMVWEDGRILWPSDWAGVIYGGGVVRLTRPEDNDVVYWRNVCGNLWFSDNEMYSEKERKLMRENRTTRKGWFW
jgi:hypothetical protein